MLVGRRRGPTRMVGCALVAAPFGVVVLGVMVLGVMVLGVMVLGVVTLTGSRADASTCWRPPVAAAVADPYREPECPWCPGNRGIEYATTAGQFVTAVAPGRVTFAGRVAGTNYVVVAVGGGRRVTYGRLVEVRPVVGDVVVSGQVIGRAGEAFHFGLRHGEGYVDPTPLLGRLVGRPRLVPTDGSEARAAPPPVLRCATGRGGAFGPTSGSMIDRSTVR